MKKILKFIILSAVVAQLFVCINLALANQNHLQHHPKSGINSRQTYQHNHQCHSAKEDCQINSSGHDNIGFYRESSKTESLPGNFAVQFMSNHNYELTGLCDSKSAFLYGKIGHSPWMNFALSSSNLRL